MLKEMVDTAETSIIHYMQLNILPQWQQKKQAKCCQVDYFELDLRGKSSFEWPTKMGNFFHFYAYSVFFFFFFSISLLNSGWRFV